MSRELGTAALDPPSELPPAVPLEPSLAWPLKLLLAMLAAAYVAPYAMTNFTPDTARDLDTAYRILSGDAFPLRGPIIASTLYLGPVWYYMLAAGMAATGSFAGVSLYVGMLASIKFALAYLTARELTGPRAGALAGRRYGFYTAIAVALPGPALLQSITWTHPNLVETAAWLVLLACAKAWRRQSDRWLLVAALALGLALHAHPTTILLAPCIALVVLQRFRARKPPSLAVVVGTLVLVALPLLPAALEPSARLAESSGLSVSIENAARHLRPAEVAMIPENMFVRVPDAVAGTFLYRAGVPGVAWHVALWTLGLALALGVVALIARPTRQLAATASIAAVAFGLGVIAIAAMRSFTPYYMSFVLLPAVALVAGAALTSLAERRAWRVVAWAATALIVTMQFAVSGGMIARAGEGWVATSLFNISNFKAPLPQVKEEALYPAWTRDAVGRALCATASPVILHGMLATGVDIAFGLETELACKAVARATLEGTEASSQHWIGLPAALWRRLGVAPARTMGGYGVDMPTAILAPVATHRIASDDHYPPRTAERGVSRVSALRFRAPANSALVVTNPIPWYLGVDVVVVTRDGLAVNALATSSNLIAFRCRECDAHEVDWTLELRSADPSWIDVVLL